MSNDSLQSLLLLDPVAEVRRIQSFLQERFQQTKLQNAVVAVSGGIDSALAVTLASQALGKDRVFPVLMPYAKQDMTDAWTIIDHLGIEKQQCRVINIQSSVEALSKSLQITGTAAEASLRLGNIMARLRMILTYDRAKELSALVVGTENKSEHYLGYFTRFGDEASDIEPLRHLYKTQVRQLAEFLRLPVVFLEKAPSAGLWEGQSDENELGFSYTEADQVLFQLIEGGVTPKKLPHNLDFAPDHIERILQRLRKVAFKHEVPYLLETSDDENHE